MEQNKKYVWIITSIVIIFCVSLFLWLKPKDSIDSTASDSSNTLNQNAVNASGVPSTQASLVGRSQEDTQINCQIRVDNANRLIVNEQTKDCFEYFITQIGEKQLPQIKADFLTYIKSSYKEPVHSQLADLWSRYIQYREELGNIPVPTFDKEDPKYFRAIFTSTIDLRKKLFSTYEIEGLFGTQDVYDQYTLDRMDVLKDKKLSAKEKSDQLKDLFDKLPEDWKENLKQLNQLEDLKTLTADIKARGGSAEELRQMRTNLVGPEATQRLETLDVQRDTWKNKVTQYLDERDTIMKSNMSDSAKQTAINELKSQRFANKQDQLRAETFEIVHDQGQPLPFAN